MNQTQKHAFPGKSFEVSRFPCKKTVNIYWETPESPTYLIEVNAKNQLIGSA
jgi:hypothetical protein